MSKKYYIPIKDNRNIEIITSEFVAWEIDLPVIVPNDRFNFHDFMKSIDVANDAIKRMMECE